MYLKGANSMATSRLTFTKALVGTGLVSCPAGKIGGKIRLVTLRTILDTRSNFHTFRQEFETANRNAAFFLIIAIQKTEVRRWIPKLGCLTSFTNLWSNWQSWKRSRSSDMIIQVKIRRLLSATLYWGAMPLSCYQRGA